MADDLPATIPALEKKIAELEKKLSQSEGLESRLIKQMADQLAALEAKLTAAKKEEPTPATSDDKPRTSISDHFIH